MFLARETVGRRASRARGAAVSRARRDRGEGEGGLIGGSRKIGLKTLRGEVPDGASPLDVDIPRIARADETSNGRYSGAARWGRLATQLYYTSIPRAVPPGMSELYHRDAGAAGRVRVARGIGTTDN